MKVLNMQDMEGVKRTGEEVQQLLVNKATSPIPVNLGNSIPELKVTNFIVYHYPRDKGYEFMLVEKLGIWGGASNIIDSGRAEEIDTTLLGDARFVGHGKQTGQFRYFGLLYQL